MSVATCPGCVAHPEEKAAQIANAIGRRLIFSLPGVHCAGCIGKVERGVSELSGVLEARLNLSQKRLYVDADPNLSDLIINRLASFGYTAHGLDQDILQKGRDPAGRALLLRLAVAGFAMMNVMLLSVSVWAGAEGETRNFLHWVSAFIALPTVAFTATPFFTSGMAALRHARLNMDVPISLAIVLATVMSLFETWAGGEDAYFDAALSLTFFLLLGRYLNHRTRMAARSAALELAALETKTALRKGRTLETVPIENLVPGDVVLVQPGMAVPVDGTVHKGSSDLNKSLLTGESLPEAVEPGAQVFSGTLNLTGPLEIRVTGDAGDSLLRQITELVSLAEAAKSRYTGLAERAAAIYAPMVHLVAFLTFVGWIWVTGDLRLSLNIAVAVLIITCPCALGLAVPAVMTAAVSRLFQAGALVKDGAAIERLAEVDAVVFDKTGTLTVGTPRLAPDTPDQTLITAAGLASGSAHPLSRAIAEAAQERGLGPSQIGSVKEHAGRGVEGTLDGRQIRLGRAQWLGINSSDTDSVQSWLQVGDADPVALNFVDPLRSDAADTIKTLQSSNLPVTMLTGDRMEVARPLAQKLGIERVDAGVLPEEKLNVVKDHSPRALMVGDGLNDAAAMSGAFVSIAPASAIDATRATADIILLGNSLNEIPRAIRLARQARRRILENFSIAALYNLVAIPLAIAGFASPLAAAIAMSSSSIIVSLNALRLMRSQA
ncbi:MAG: cadmium-translocating P-type ATPase [Rhodobacteraceae bacterium]|nr:cadmium-translocating P-type ATPase [Paracoccaceae bacterium]